MLPPDETTEPEVEETQPDAEEQQETPETSDASAAEEEGAEAKAEKPGDEEEAKPPEEEAKEEQPEEKRRRAGGFQRKIDRLERERALLLDQLAAQRQSQPAAAKPAAEQTPEEKAAAYIDNLVQQRLEAREREKQSMAAQAEFQRRTQEVRAQNPDFDDVIMSASDAPVSDAVREALLTSEHGPAIMYQLAKSPAELARLSALPPLLAAREIGRLEAKLSSVAPSPVKQKPAIRPPAPPTSVNGRPSSTRSLEELSISEYKRAMRSGRR